MLINNYYNINLKINGNSITTRTPDFSFTIIDSINDIYNKGILQLVDEAGLAQEFLLTAEATPVEISFGAFDVIDTCIYGILPEKLPNSTSQLFLAGTVEIPLINNWYFSQEIKSKAYNDRISKIIQRIANTYLFNKVIINDTGNQDFWYQPLINDVEFINNILPYAYSQDSDKSPFYCFTNSNNEFNLRTFYKMLAEKPVADLYFEEESKTIKRRENIKEDLDKLRITSVKSISRFKKNTLYKNKKRYIYYIDNNTGELLQETDSIFDFLKREQNEYISSVESNLYSNYKFLNNTTDLTGRAEGKLGFQINSMKEPLEFENILLITSYNPLLKSGVPINFYINCFSGTDTTNISQFSGKYLITYREHIWDGVKQIGFTKIIISRKYTKLNNNYLLKDKLIK